MHETLGLTMPLLAKIWLPAAGDLRLVLPDLLLIATIVAILLAPLLSRRSLRVPGLLALLGAVVGALACWFVIGDVAASGSDLFGVAARDGSSGPAMLVADRVSLFFRMFLMVFLIVIVAMWMMTDGEREQNPHEFLTLLLASALGMSLMTSANHLLMVIVAIELASLPSYGLAGFDKFRRTAAEASVKYVVFGAATSGLMIYGASLLFGMFGTLHVPTLAARLATGGPGGPLLAVGLLAFFAGVGFKISAVPFHFWCPDVFEGASLPVATWLSVASKAAGLLLLLRMVFAFAGHAGGEYSQYVLPTISYGVGVFAILTCTFANFAAYRQTNIRRMLAYSSIAHAGYMLMAGAIVVRSSGYENAMSAVVAYLLIYMFMNLGAFMTLGLVAADTGEESMKSFAGLGWRDALTAAAMTVCLISLVGLPPLGGFYVKWWILAALGGAAREANMPFLWVLALVLALNTAVSLYYYARVVWQMYFVPPEHEKPLRAPGAGKALVVACALLLILTGTIWVRPLKSMADRYTSNMYTVSAARTDAGDGLAAAVRP
ncbi:MAG: NADH-quinone oxidoreductase subunit N [Phycisphaerae bacterium]|nr:NADH-quinone oxidoreductase subunit N [Phycisphaerae bacterium]